jgi:broad specificity phosphatase PhoE
MAEKTVKQKIKEALAEEHLTAKEIAHIIGVDLKVTKNALSVLCKDWEVKLDREVRGKEKPYMLTVPQEPNRNWRFKELLEAWNG